MFSTIRDICVFIENYCGMTFSEHCRVGCGVVKIWGKDLATFEFDEKSGIPIFTFAPEYITFQCEQERSRWKALEELFGYPRVKPRRQVDWFLGTLEYKEFFSYKKQKVDVFFNREKMEFVIYLSGEERVLPFFGVREDAYPIEKEAQQRVWALIQTELPEDFQGFLRKGR